MIQFSPGAIVGCLELLDMVGRINSSIGELVTSFPRLGGVKTVTVLQTAQALGWLAVSESGGTTVTRAGSRVLGAGTYELRLRQAILDYIDATRPAWLQTAASGRSRTLQFLDNDVAQVFAEAGLSDGTEGDVVNYWDFLAARARGQKNIRLTEIGRQGERLSMEYELRRTGKHPRWVAVDCNLDGYDILSVVDRDDHAQLSIEVKASIRGDAGSFHLTANEWSRAQNTKNHLFHLWDLSANSKRLAIVSAEGVCPHVPENQGHGTWEHAEIPFSAFSDKFFEQGIDR